MSEGPWPEVTMTWPGPLDRVRLHIEGAQIELRTLQDACRKLGLSSLADKLSSIAFTRLRMVLDDLRIGNEGA
jgi:hypothetical protein